MDRNMLTEMLTDIIDSPEIESMKLRIVDIISYAQFLLDNDDNLTSTGNLNSTARNLLRNRICSLCGFGPEKEGDDQDSDAD